jgi:hypothetical protein
MSAVDGLFTVNDVIVPAFQHAGILGLGQTLDGSDVLSGQNALSYMLGQWNVKTWLVFERLDTGFVSDGRFTPYTVGPGGNYNFMFRPDRIEAAYLRILSSTPGQPVDQPLRIIPSREEYSNIALKQLVAFPKGVFYDTASPTANLFIYPWPQGALYETHIITKNSFPLQLPLTQDLSTLPPEARPAMIFCLARRLRSMFGKKADPELNALAKDALETMRNSHIQVPELKMPSAIMGRSKYNIYGDTTY